jgi:hypothetical protein
MIFATDDELKALEKRFGPKVRDMGTSNSDGVFGYSVVPVAVVEKAAQAVGDPGILKAFHELKKSPERTLPFIEMVNLFGPALVEKIAPSYRECITLASPAQLA